MALPGSDEGRTISGTARPTNEGATQGSRSPAAVTATTPSKRMSRTRTPGVHRGIIAECKNTQCRGDESVGNHGAAAVAITAPGAGHRGHISLPMIPMPSIER